MTDDLLCENVPAASPFRPSPGRIFSMGFAKKSSAAVGMICEGRWFGFLFGWLAYSGYSTCYGWRCVMNQAKRKRLPAASTFLITAEWFSLLCV